MKRGSIYLAAQDPGYASQRGGEPGTPFAEQALRPVVLVSRDAINRVSLVVLICPLVDAASMRQLYPSDVAVRAPEGGLTADSIVLTGQLRALARTQLVRQLGELSQEVMRQLDRALRITLDLD